MFAEHELEHRGKYLPKALDILLDKEFLELGEQHYGIYWTSDTPTWKRPLWLYPWQPDAGEERTTYAFIKYIRYTTINNS